ncbi:mucin-19-like isoform X2 [Brachionus plicatilis]|uniref:Mucin-19-like isoform X2 n=1 Tax=Brachionus plicatilis TaxID=10195 RepID=A0A3M7PC71_BRAPC|nr:mucin-19-like isoform X2 [Brachionus plicatilis]
MNFKICLSLIVFCALLGQRNAQSLEEKCLNGNGYFTDPRYQCKVFYRCVNTGQPGFEIKTFHCPYGLYFDSKKNLCDRPDNVECF